MKNKKILIAVVVLVVAFGGWLMHYFSDNEAIKRQFRSIALELSKQGMETPVMIALKMRPVQDFLYGQCKVAVPESNYQEVLERDLIIRYIITYRSRHANLLVALDELAIDITVKGEAQLSVLVHVTANHDQPDFFEETYRVEFGLQKLDKKWLINKAILPASLVKNRAHAGI